MNKKKEYVAGPPVDLDTEVVRDKKGRRIDQAYVDRVIKSAEAVRPRGRPGLSKTPGASPQIAVRLTPDVYEAATKVAAERGLSLAALAREAVEQHVTKGGTHDSRSRTRDSSRSASVKSSGRKSA